MTTDTKRARTERTWRGTALPAAIVGFLLVLGVRTIGALPGDWLGWLLQCWGMA